MKKFTCILITSIAVISQLGCIPARIETEIPVETSRPCVGPAFTIGEVSDNPVEVITATQPLADYMAKRLVGFGFECGRAVVPDTVNEMIELVKNEEVDIYLDSIYPATLVSIATGTQPILRRWRNCDPEYYSVIFTTTESSITAVGDLRGHMIAMDRSYSTSGFALPATYLIDQGLNLVVKDSFDEPVSENEVGIYFSGADENTLNLVLEGKVSAGTTDDYHFDKWDKEAPGKLVKLAETISVPRQVVLVRPGLESQLQEAIKKELANADLDPEGLVVLGKYSGTCKFDDSPVEIRAAFEQMQQVHTKIKQIPGWQEAFDHGH